LIAAAVSSARAFELKKVARSIAAQIDLPLARGLLRRRVGAADRRPRRNEIGASLMEWDSLGGFASGHQTGSGDATMRLDDQSRSPLKLVACVIDFDGGF
jgi:hypothetical protein